MSEKRLIVGGEIGTHDFYRAEIDANIPLIGDSLLFRVNAGYENAFETLFNDDSKTAVIAPTLTWIPSKKFEITLDYQNFRRREDGMVSMKPNMQVDLRNDTAASNPALHGRADGERAANIDYGFLGFFPLPADFNYAGNGDFRDTFSDSYNAEAFFRFNSNWSGRFNYSYSDNHSKHKLTGLASVALTPPTGVTNRDFAEQILANPMRGRDAATATLQRRKRYIEEKGDSKSYQVEMTGKIFFDGGLLKPVFGAYQRDGKNGAFTNQGNGAPPANVPNSSTTPAQRFQNWNMFDSSTWDFAADYDPFALPNVANQSRSAQSKDSALYATGNLQMMDERLNIVAGLRYNETESVNLRAPSEPKFTASKTTPQFGVGYKITKDILLYGSYSESFTISERFLQSGTVVIGPAKPVQGEGLELGLKTTMLD